MTILISENIVDMHSHTIHSFDGHYSVDELCDTCIERGIKAVAFTDHLELDFFHEKGFDKTADEAFVDITRAKEKYSGRLEVLVSAEMGQPVYDTAVSDELIRAKDYDFIAGSIHNLRNREDFALLDYNNLQCDKDLLLKEYFYEEKLMAEWAKFDTLAHLTYPLRYMVGVYGLKVDLSKFEGDIDEVLSLLVEKDKALEINTSGLRQKLGLTMPDRDVVKRFKELGGKYITVGSDSHYTEHMGAGIADGYEIAESCGFKSVLIFRKRQPIEIPIK